MSGNPIVASSLASRIDTAAQALEPRVIAWRRDLHEHPELGNREFRTSALVAAHLRKLGLDEVRTGVAHTGIVGVLKGALPGPVVALRADMDALPVTEEVDVPFASKARAIWNGEEVRVMHACGHDMHGTIRTFDEVMRDDVHERVTYLAEAISRGSRAGCTVCIRKNYPVTVNDPALTAAMVPTLSRVAGAERLHLIPKVMGSEDFSFFQKVVPGLFFFVGVVPPGTPPDKAAPNHSPRFHADEGSLVFGVRALAHLACDFLEAHADRKHAAAQGTEISATA